MIIFSLGTPSGLPMESPIPLLAEIFLDLLEHGILWTFPLKNAVKFHYRYVDGIFLFEGSDRQLQNFLNHAKSFHSSINLTREIESNTTS